MNNTNAKDQWQTLGQLKSEHYSNAQLYAALCARHLLPEEEIPNDFVRRQSFTQRMVTNLANTITETLFPATRPAFNLKAKAEFVEDMEPAEKDKLDRKLSVKAEATGEIMRKGEYTGQALRIITQAMVMGTALYKINKDGIETFNLSEFNIRRNPDGSVVEIITIEYASEQQLDELVSNGHLSQEDRTHALSMALTDSAGNATPALYTWIKRKGKKWTVSQYIEESVTAISTSTYGEMSFPYHICDWQATRGRTYAVGLVEENIADINRYDLLSEMTTRSTVKSLDYRNFVHPNAGVDITLVNQAYVGDFVAGDPEGIKSVSTGVDGRTLAEALGHLDMLKRDLSQTFLMTASSVREGERVTAFEIQETTKSLERAFGGVYIGLTAQIQRPIITYAVKATDLSGLDVDIELNTGVEALSRYVSLSNMRSFLQDLGGLAQAIEPFTDEIDKFSIVKQLAADNNIPQHKVLKSLEDATKAKEQAEAAEMAQQAQAPQGPQALPGLPQ